MIESRDSPHREIRRVARMNVIGDAARTWIVLRRDLSATVRITTGENVWATMVLDDETERIVASHLGATKAKSLAGALAAALEEPIAGAPSGPPSTLVVEPGMASEIGDLLAGLGKSARIVEDRVPDWAADVLDGLTAHLSGRRRGADWPEPEEWSLLYQQAVSYAQARPWARYDDTVYLRLDLKIGAQRMIRAATILGNAGAVRGLAVHPGEHLPAQVLSGDTSKAPPSGSLHFSLNRREELPPDIVSRADRYGWPPGLDEVPAFFGWKAEGGGEIERTDAVLLTVALAAAIDVTAADRGLGYEAKGELILGAGKRARYRARFESSELQLPPGLRLYAGKLQHDLLPEDAIVGLGGIPWDELELVRARARRHQAAPQVRPRSGDGLPALIIAVEGRSGEQVAERLANTEVQGVTLPKSGSERLIVVLTEGGAFGVGQTSQSDAAPEKFTRRLHATRGWHAVIVAPPRFRRSDAIHGFFECVLAPAPEESTSAGRLRRPTRRKRGK